MAAALLYWAACAVLLPVTTWDSQVYNLGRLLIAEKAGFWSNPHWFSERQVIFPWAFDAVHYRFVKLGFGEAIPSLVCFVGLLIIVYKILRDRYSSQLALLVCLGLVSMPTMVYQATSTKNDLVVVFLVGCWFYSLFRYRRERASWLLAACGLSLSFLAGAKTSGIFFAILLFPFTLLIIRRYKAQLTPFLASLIVSVVLFGSVETYLLSYFRYGHPLGPRAFVKMHSNRDGAAGAMANFIRYYIGNISLGAYSDHDRSTLPGQLEALARYSLKTLNLTDAGYRSDFNDSNLRYLKTGTDDSSDFGIFGWLAFTTCLLIPFFAPLCSAAWLTAIAGLCSMAVISYTIGWMPWNARFLVLPYTLFATAALIFVFEEIRTLQTPVRRLFVACILFSVIAAPFISQLRQPPDLVRSLRKREELTFSEQTKLLPVFRELTRIAAQYPEPIVYLSAGANSWVLEFLRIRNIQWRIVSSLADLAHSTQAFAGPQPVYLVILGDAPPAGLDPTGAKQFDPTDSIWKLYDPNPKK